MNIHYIYIYMAITRYSKYIIPINRTDTCNYIFRLKFMVKNKEMLHTNFQFKFTVI